MDTANGTPILTYSTRYVEVSFGGRRFGWDFVMAAVSTPLLGADFLCAFNLLVDVTICHLIDALSMYFLSHHTPAHLGGLERFACRTLVPLEIHINASSLSSQTSPRPRSHPPTAPYGASWLATPGF